MSVYYPGFLTKTLLVAAFASTGVLAGGCTSCEEEKRDPVDSQLTSSLADEKGIQISLALTDVQRDDAARLLAKLNGQRFPKRYTGQEKNAPLFLYIAAKSDSPHVIVAALRAMHEVYVGPMAKRRQGRRLADKDYAAVVAAHLKSQNATILQAAIDASHHALRSRQPDAGTIAQLGRIVESHPVVGARIDAVSALTRVPHYRANQRIATAFLKALEHPSAALLSHSLYQLYQHRASGLVRRHEFLQRARRLLKHPDPGVRGRAARVAAVLGAGNSEVVEQIRGMLSDQHPYTRSVVAHALADMNDVAAIHLLVARVEEYVRNSHHTKYKKLDGGEGIVPHGAKDETVHDPVLKAIVTLSAKLATPYQPPSKDAGDSGRKQNTAAFRQWFAKHKSLVPKLETMPAPLDATVAAGQAHGAAAGQKPASAKPLGSSAPPARPRGAGRVGAAAPKPSATPAR